MEILIRPWRRADFPAVRKILWETWSAAYSAFIPLEDLKAYLESTYRIDALSEIYDNPHVRGFIAEADGEAVGYARTQFHRDEKRIYLASLYILPGFQGTGIGGRLLRAAEDEALANRLKELWVGVMAQNVHAGRWYERRGFHFVLEEPFRMARTTVPHRIGYKVVVQSVQGDSLERRLFAAFSGEDEPLPLGDLAASLLESQRGRWLALAEGYAVLNGARTREIQVGMASVRVQYNPGRAKSSTAPVDPESVRNRRCFLCPDHLPPEQEGILYRDDYLLLCNPAPIFPVHYTIAHRRHLPQSLSDSLETFLQLAEDLGPRLVVLYNGPRCGASAPDHLHFQAVPSRLLPVEAAVSASRGRTILLPRGAAEIFDTDGLWCGAIVIEGGRKADVAAAVRLVMSVLGGPADSPEEPMLNLIASYWGGRWRLILFPRLKHRPDAYFREGAGRLLVSPGAVDMGGLLITPREEDFLAMDSARIQDIFREVAFDERAVETVLASLPG